jgi:two-component system, cell cycle response regulator
MKIKILLVDDNQTVRGMIRDRLQDWGYEVSEAVNGLDALEKLLLSAVAENRPNILLLDWRMPELDGVALCRWIKTECQTYKTGPYLYVLFLTVSEGSDFETQAFKAGADGYIVKGSWEELEAKMNSVKSRVLEDDELRNTIASLKKDPSGVLIKKEIIRRLERRTDSCEQAPIGIVLMDIDNFKQINDTYGHLVGDQILEAVGRRLHESVRNGNVGRFGGDEFLIGLPGCNYETTQKRAQEIVFRLTADPISTTEGEKKITISYGIAVDYYPVNLDHLIGIADAELYKQKHEKKTTIHGDRSM